MTFLLVVIGALLGAFVCAGVFQESVALTGTLFGALIGLLLAQLARLRQRLGAIEHSVLSLREAALRAEHAAAIPAAPIVPSPAVPATTPIRAAELSAAPLASLPTEQAAAAAPSVVAPAPAVTARTVPHPPYRPVPPSEPDLLSRAVERIKRWFTEGNVPVKVGVIVLFLGVAALLKYASDAGWLRLPVSWRLAGIAAAALAALAFAWFKRASHRAFALSLQGGAIGVLMLDVFGAFRLYELLPAGIAFALLVAIVAAGGALAVLQDALALAVLAIVGGFLAPILISTGSGNHVALFSYYAVLNAAILVIAWLKPWRALNLLGWAFTFAIGLMWGVLSYRPEQFGSTEPFLLLFFAFYLCIPVFYAHRLAPDKRGLIDGTLVFGTPLIVFALQASLLWPERMPLAYSALGAAAIYGLLATAELRAWGYRLLGESHALLGLGFATVAVPLALSARTTSSTWALEGAALIWLGLRQQRRLPRWIGYGLQVAAAVALVDAYWAYYDTSMVLNGLFLGALLLALAGIVSARLLSAANPAALLAALLFVWGWGWAWFAAGYDIDHFVPARQQANWWLAVFAVSGLLGAEAFRHWRWRESAWPALAAFALAPPMIAATLFANHGPLEGAGAAAWALWLVAALRALHCLHAGRQRFFHIAHFVFLWTCALVLGAQFADFADDHLDLAEIWAALALLAPLALLFWLALSHSALVRWPDAAAAQRTRFVLLASLAAVLGVAWLGGLFVEGEAAPVPYLPVFNPLEAAQLGYLALMVAWYRRAAREGGALLDAEVRARVLAAAGVVLLTAITLRSSHFLGGVPWDESLWDSPLAQAALSIVWTLAGIAAMLLGKQRESRAVWIGGSVLMGVVILKLLLIDRQHLHDLAAIVGVLIVGVLLVGVGYFAPAPPRKVEAPA
jgi:uncharacterized membrane protein